MRSDITRDNKKDSPEKLSPLDSMKKDKSRMTTEGDLKRIVEIATDLNPRAVAAEVSLLTGARLRAWNPESGPSSNSVHSPALVPDAVDKWCQRKSKGYRENIRKAAKLLEDALFYQGELLVRLHDGEGNPTEEAMREAAEAVSPQAETCVNCRRIVERTAADKLLGGRCRQCHRYLKEHGVERPERFWVVAA